MKELAARYTYTPEGRLISNITGNFGDIYINAAGYRRVSWDRGRKGRIRVLAHHVVWYIHNGEIPEGMMVDHINLDFLDNRIENLRLITRSGNGQNSKRKGYSFAKREGKFKAEITLNYKCKFLGYFDTESEAREAYIKAKRELHPYASENVLN